MAKTEKKLIANNKKAYHDYFILEKYEAGIVLARNRSKVSAYGQSAVSKKHSSVSKTGRCLSMVCTSVLMRREISLTKIRFV